MKKRILIHDGVSFIEDILTGAKIPDTKIRRCDKVAHVPDLFSDKRYGIPDIYIMGVISGFCNFGVHHGYANLAMANIRRAKEEYKIPVIACLSPHDKDKARKNGADYFFSRASLHDHGREELVEIVRKLIGA